MSMKKKILVIAANPDDEILGCGGTVARLTNRGYEAYTPILGEGVTSRDDFRDCTKRINELNELKEQFHQANKIIGTKESFERDFPNNRFNSVALLNNVKVIKNIKSVIQSDNIFILYENDLNIDHCTTYRAIITTINHLPIEKVKEKYTLEVN